MFLLAHISDLHMGPPPGPSLADLCSKRILGYLSWQARRRRQHLPAVLEALCDDLAEMQPDHVAVTGDLVNLSLPDEFVRAETWLNGLGPADRVTVVPGNHDTYVSVPWSESLAHWKNYMAGDTPESEQANGPASFDDFPQVRVRGEVAFVCLSSALPTMPFSAMGQIGAAQLSDLESALQELGDRGLYRVVLMHHGPLAARVKLRRQLSDRRAFQSVIARAGAELILHGHHHHFSLGRIETAAEFTPVVGVPSASAGPQNAEPSRYHLFRIDREAGKWRTDAMSRRLDVTTGRFTRGDGFDLAGEG